jgi:hypothetical protein
MLVNHGSPTRAIDFKLFSLSTTKVDVLHISPKESLDMKISVHPKTLLGHNVRMTSETQLHAKLSIQKPGLVTTQSYELLYTIIIANL